MDPDGPIDGIDQPDFRDVGAFVGAQFGDAVVAGGSGRKDLCNPVGRAPHAAFVQFLKITGDEEIGLHHGIDLIVLAGWRRRIADISDTVNDLVAAGRRPGEVVGVGVVLYVAYAHAIHAAGSECQRKPLHTNFHITVGRIGGRVLTRQLSND